MRIGVGYRSCCLIPPRRLVQRGRYARGHVAAARRGHHGGCGQLGAAGRGCRRICARCWCWSLRGRALQLVRHGRNAPPAGSLADLRAGPRVRPGAADAALASLGELAVADADHQQLRPGKRQPAAVPDVDRDAVVAAVRDELAGPRREGATEIDALAAGNRARPLRPRTETRVRTPVEYFASPLAGDSARPRRGRAHFL